MQDSAKLSELPEEFRGDKRQRVLLAATIETGGESRKANLLNLSSGGALLDAEVPPEAGAELSISRGALQARGRVAWVNEHRFGVAFDQPIDEALVRDYVAAAAPAKKVVPFR